MSDVYLAVVVCFLSFSQSGFPAVLGGGDEGEAGGGEETQGVLVPAPPGGQVVKRVSKIYGEDEDWNEHGSGQSPNV